MKGIGIAFLLLTISVCAQGQDKSDLLRNAIGYYQNLQYSKSIDHFDRLVAMDSSDVSMRGRRGFVICRYLMASEAGNVAKIKADEFKTLANKAKSDLMVSLEEYPGNPDNAACLQYLKKKGY